MSANEKTAVKNKYVNEGDYFINNDNDTLIDSEI